MARRGFAAFVLVAAAALALAPAGFATTKTALSLTSFADLVVDDAHGHVFVSGGTGTSSVVVVDFSGQVVTTIADEPGASGMALDAANSLLYVALRDSNAIAVIDTATLTETGRISIAPAASPRSVAFAGGRLWFSHDCNSASRFGSIATNGTDLQQFELGHGYPFQCPIFAVDPSDDDVLVATGQGTTGPTVFIYDASTAVPTLTLSKQMGDSDDFEDMTLTPDGSGLLAAAGSPYFVQKFKTSDLSSTGSFPTGAYPVAAAVTSDGAYAAAGIDTVSGKEVVVFPFGSTTALRGYEFGLTTGTEIYDASLAFSNDSTKLFSVAHPEQSGGIVFRVHGSPTLPPVVTTTTLTVSKSTIPYNGSVKLTARVNGTQTGTMAIYATQPYVGRSLSRLRPGEGRGLHQDPEAPGDDDLRRRVHGQRRARRIRRAAGASSRCAYGRP